MVAGFLRRASLVWRIWPPSLTDHKGQLLARPKSVNRPTETGADQPNPLKCRRFCRTRKSRGRDLAGWLWTQSSANHSLWVQLASCFQEQGIFLKLGREQGFDRPNAA